MTDEKPYTTCIYEIDAEDIITHVNPYWTIFAEQNAGDRLRPEDVLGAPLWRYIQNMDVQQIYHELAAWVRKTRRTASLRFRCDAPDRRRLHEMKIIPLDGGGLRFECAILLEEPWESKALLDRAVARAEEYLAICSICKRIRVDDARWYELEEAIAALRILEEQAPPQLSHGLCDTCAEEQLLLIQELTAAS